MKVPKSIYNGKGVGVSLEEEDKQRENGILGMDGNNIR